MNQHIIENLNYYVNVENPEYAFLLSGDWGTGKTHFIESYMNRYNEEEDNKIIKISLFGLNKTSQIDEKIFQEVHPILSHKYTKLAGNILKGAFKLGFKVDINGDNQDDLTIGANLDKINFDNSSSLGNKKGEFIIVLDDLERTDIQLKEILGYINYLVEISKVKVIIVANESKLLTKNMLNAEDSKSNDSKLDKIYEEFKEKVIGKTFEIQHDFEEVLSLFLTESKCVHLIENRELIKKIYLLSNSKNLRNIKQAILDFNYLLSSLNSEYSEGSEFIYFLIRNFFSLTIEIKNGNISKDSLISNVPFKRKDIITGEENIISKKYSLYDTPIYSGKVWADILLKGDLSQLNEHTSKLIYFTQKTEETKPTWLKLWSFTRMNDENEFISLSKSLKKDFESLKEEDPIIYLHNLALLIFFSKNNLIKLDIEKIKSIVPKYIKKHKNSSKWPQKNTFPFSFVNKTGHAYYNDNDEDFQVLRGMIEDKIKLETQSEIEYEKDKEYENLLLGITEDNIQLINNFFLDNYQYKPILDKIDPIKFVKSIAQASNSTIIHINAIINERYFSNTSMNNSPLFHQFKNEYSFWVSVNSKIDEDINKYKGIKQYNLRLLNEASIKKILDILK
ncbi:P-loop NTPase fold protein [Pectobacterium parmentieri]|uniref:P-loop NTPase fold protein n=1 Tax=Pectobacterium parmentieri TaxID=1905730 RepID=UPI0020317756|nr:P-loop NTPase fold protein [Pectobacterium parmentieri]MCL6381509.1 hypothetical protein [Pectobacterium parmentieri]